ncbi:MAG TPA: hypothetical protein VGP47_05085 [Parachlamydiaceae bacterium]|nr:hypothetical protein [Parachlamydiaceae bacterium]
MFTFSSLNRSLIALCATAAFAGFAFSDTCLYAAFPSQTQTLIPSKVTIHERLYTFSNYFEIDSDVGHQGNLIKTKLALRTNYQYYNHMGQHVSSAYLRLFSLGSLCTWAGVLDVYDDIGNRIGLIEGAVVTLLPSKFSLYGAQNELVGTAYMDHDSMGFTISDAVNESKTIANFRRVFVKDVVDHWEITINDPYAIDIRLVYSFGAFVLDNQNDFRVDD